MRWPVVLVLLLVFSMAANAAILDDEISPGSNVIIRSIDYLPFPAVPGESFEMSIVLKNNDPRRVINNPKLAIQEAFPFTINSVDTRVKSITSIAQGQEATVTFMIDVDEKAALGLNRLDIEYTEALDGNLPGSTMIYPVNIEVQKESAALATSSLSVTDVRTIPSQLEPGKEAKLILNLRNTGSFLMRDVNIKLDFTGLPFTPIDSSTNQRVKAIMIDGAVSLEFNIVVDSDADLKAYKIPVTITFKDDVGQEFNISDTVGLAVVSKPEYFLNLEESKVYSKGDSGKIVVSLSNTGVSDLKFATLKIEPSNDYEIISSNSNYLGNLEPDDFETADFQIHIINGKDSVPLLFELAYKDSYNKEYRDKKIVNMPLYSRSELTSLGLVAGNGNYSFIMYLILIILAYLVFKNWRKHKDIGQAFKYTFKSVILFLFEVIKLLNPAHLKRQIKKLIKFLKDDK